MYRKCLYLFQGYIKVFKWDLHLQGVISLEEYNRLVTKDTVKLPIKFQGHMKIFMHIMWQVFCS